MSTVEPGPTDPVLTYAPDTRLTALAGAGALAAAARAVLLSDPAGRVLYGIAALLLLGYVVGDLVFRPRLRVDRGGLRIRSPFARRDLGWDELERVRPDVRTRLGLRSASLEIDAGTVLVVFSRRALGGADPEQVAGLIAAMDPRGRPD